MAHVDNLIERISDPHLRAQIAEEVAKLVERKDFGLVFQRHLPEDLEVPGTKPRRGDIVRLRADADNQKAKLAMQGVEAAVQQVMLQDKVWYRVRLGPFRKIEQVNAMRAELARQGIPANVVKKD